MCPSFDQNIWDKVFKNVPSKFCGRQPLKFLLGPFLNTLSQFSQPEITRRFSYDNSQIHRKYLSQVSLLIKFLAYKDEK